MGIGFGGCDDDDDWPVTPKEAKREIAPRKAIYAGSFDPLTKGHLWLIEQGSKLFDELIVVVASNADKKTLLTTEERVGAIKTETTRMQNVSVQESSNVYIARWAKSCSAYFLLRGIRTGADVPFEQLLRNINGDIQRDIATVFLMPPRELADISSSLVKGLIGFKGWETAVSKYVPETSLKLLRSHKSAT